jgi:hypothetical protein
MMKKIILAIGLMFGGVAFVNAQEQQDTTQTQTQQSDQYRSDTTSTDDSQNQDQTQQDQNQSDTTSTQQSDMYRTETDSTSTGTESTTTGTESTTTGTESTTTGTESTTTTPPTTDDQASSTQSTDQSGVSQDDQEQEGEKIEVSELPAAVQAKLQSTDYQGWVVASARKKMWTDPSDTQATAKEVYVIEAKNGSETKKLKFDKDGNEIEHDKHKKDDQK